MILYHGTTKDFTVPDLGKANPYTDFGPGFYLTDNKEMADVWFKNAPNKHILTYKVTLADIPTCNLHIKRFNQADVSWAKFVYNNRRGNNLKVRFDLIIGPVADNGLEIWLEKIDKSECTWDEFAKKVNFKRFKALQYCFLKENALKLIRYESTR